MTEPNETTVEYWNEMICNDSLASGDSPEQFSAACQSLISMLEAHIDSTRKFKTALLNDISDPTADIWVATANEYSKRRQL